MPAEGETLEGAFERLAEYASEDEARTAARTLLESGIGPEVRFEADARKNLLTGDSGVHALYVLESEAQRARELLGLPAPEPEPPSGEEGEEDGKRSEPEGAKVHSFFGGRVQATTRQAVVAIGVYLAALILIPLAVFWGTQWLLTEDAPEVPDSIPIEGPDEGGDPPFTLPEGTIPFETTVPTTAG